MSADIRTLAAVGTLAIVLTVIAWSAGRARPFGQDSARMEPRTSVPRPAASPPRAPVRDASFVEDAISLSDFDEDDLANLFASAICGRRAVCGCDVMGDRDGASCAARVRAQFEEWWDREATGPYRLRDAASLDAVVRDAVTCERVEISLDRLVITDAVEGEACWLTCRDGSDCLEGVCVRLRGVGESCTVIDDPDLVPDETGEDENAFVGCQIELDCVHGTCSAGRAEGERCSRPRDCGVGLECVDGVCVGPAGPGEACAWPEGPTCQLEEFDCLGGRCVRVSFPIPECRDGVLNQVDSRPTRWSCVPIGTTCFAQSECSFGICSGDGTWRCVDSPTADDSRDDPSAATCAPGVDCLQEDCGCPSDLVCDTHQRRCVRAQRRGELCDTLPCAPGLQCEYLVPDGGRCIGAICDETSVFPAPVE